MLTREAVDEWLNAYSGAWLTYDPEVIGKLFSDDATYAYSPYGEPIRGREAIVANWLENRDEPGTYTSEYHVVMAEGLEAVANGRSQYFGEDHQTIIREYDNIFLLTFNDVGQCRVFTEWFMERPKSS